MAKYEKYEKLVSVKSIKKLTNGEKEIIFKEFL